MTARRLSVPPPAWFLLALGTQFLIARRRPTTTFSRAASAGLGMAAAALAGSAFATFRQHGTTVDPEHPERASALVTDGPFRLTRNPMYLALGCLLIAHAVLRNSLPALAPVAGFVFVIDRAQIPAEERALSRRFGAGYERYRSTVPRWLAVPRREGPGGVG
ncbi:MAG TPA: isoprenylcysteine carboxylmethyltransferase family protein [Humibacter sp.]|jgi:protein-S-isoprenylcysteine O-methyltransferase Ste14|nr:isoprenylcysteine carboxylmethyltransferase family protein [Humibacter sp.]